MSTQKSPWAWHSPPLPSAFSLVSQSPDTPHDRIYYRKLWGLEASMAVCTYALPGMANILVSCHITPPPGSSAPIDEPLVRAAVRALRFEQPTIATKLAFAGVAPGTFPQPDNGRFAYVVPASEEDVSAWLDDVVVTHAGHADIAAAVEAVTHALTGVGTSPPTTLFDLHFIPSTGADPTCAVVLNMGHALFDGIGCWLFLDLFTAKLAWMMGDPPSRANQPIPWGDEVARLAGAVPDRLKVPWAPEKIDEDLIMVDKLREAASIPKTVPGLHVPHPLGPPSKTGVWLKPLPPTTVKLLTAYARAHNCTLFTLFIAATVLALLRLHPPPDPSHAIDMPMYPAAVNLRGKSLREGEDKRAIAMTVGFHVYVARALGRFVREGQGEGALGTLAREIKAQVDEQMRYMDRAAFWGHEMLEFMGHYAASAKARDRPPEERAGTLPTLPSISSLGVMDPYLSPHHPIPVPIPPTPSPSQHLTTSHVHLRMRMPYNPSLLVHPYTWQGTCYVAASFAEGYWGTLAEQEACGDEEGAPVVTFMNAFMRILEEAAASMDGAASKAEPVVNVEVPPVVAGETPAPSKPPASVGRWDLSHVLSRLWDAWGGLRPTSPPVVPP
ncbi:hypothetical protein OE88DRAFT_1739865 [Heliocybe sulcata]|uniref:CoA-dependent acyltransferase n=1 Tax=Heliocybe sulcata TaxID=5364 RepID=A0A5C3MLZ4_9AGAM|nr:hypothetical protein OE88DRAFT_1739865 [Heliocybe sulcata]